MTRGPLFANCPLLPLAVCLALGIAIGGLLADGWLACLLAVLLVVAWLLRKSPLAQSVTLNLCCVVLGMACAPEQSAKVADGVWTEAVVASMPVERPKTVMIQLLLPATDEQRRCYFWTDEHSRHLQIGDNLLVSISDSQFVRRGDWHAGGEGFSLLSRWQRLRIRALQWRLPLLERLSQQSGDGDAQAIISAMVLGDKSLLTRELRQTYASSGASHVLALSGLHLSIIYLLLTRLTLGRRRSWLIQSVVVLAIWAYALLTGLSTSVVRAAIMLSVYSLFSLGGRRHASLGVLSFTAIVMLLADSSSLFDVGFQLSFMAMLGILLFVPLFEQCVSTKWMMTHRPVKWLYDLVIVSLAAQLGTAPLVAYYFGQFPTWFLLTNLVVMPFATIILLGGVLTLLFPSLGGILLWLAGLLNSILDGISHLPLASIGGLHPSALQVAMLYLLIGLAYIALTRYVPVCQRRLL
ncbi:MAG: ComEC/Rec2 family competence protein [Prevotella sp.]|nr:ComEC/Rec2 family competence protein [Prevotella sp.]